ncbi:MAG: multiprotein bridging factor aMBF1 [Promethearchaeota archaeon]
MFNENSSKFDKECPICGSIIWDKGEKVLLEGAKITVCSVCAKHGQKIREKPSFHAKNRQISPGAPTRKNNSRRNEILEKEIVEDYANKIRNARSRMNLTQEKFSHKINEKPSLMKRIEAGKAKPTIQLAKKLEKNLKIKLLKDADEIEVNTSRYMKKKSGASLGDIAYIKKKPPR